MVAVGTVHSYYRQSLGGHQRRQLYGRSARPGLVSGRSLQWRDSDTELFGARPGDTLLPGPQLDQLQHAECVWTGPRLDLDQRPARVVRRLRFGWEQAIGERR